MELSTQQTEAYDKVGRWLRDPTSRVFRLDGFAGTGKTTIAKKLASQHDGEVLFGAFTGKAASVLTRRGCPATTLHSLLYTPVIGSREVIERKQKELANTKDEAIAAALRQELVELNTLKFEFNHDSPLKDTDLLIVDEVSMVGEDLGNDLLRFDDLKILVLGDPGQLPPVSGEGFFQTKFPCDHLLTEIHRQAAGNPIITLATLVRQGHSLRPGAYGNSRVQRRSGTTAEHLVSADQIIVGANSTRKKFNALVRDQLRHHSVSCPDPGEKIICLKNDKEVGLLNGTQWAVLSSVDNGLGLDLGIVPWEDREKEGGKPLLCSAHPFDRDLKNMPWWERKLAQEFDFGYAITCHKAQGSQWEKVFVQDEGWMFKEHAKKWIYTAITRAEESVVVAV